VHDLIKDKLLFFLKYSIGIILLVWVLSRVDRKSLLDSIIGLNIGEIAGILFIALINLAFQFNLWRILISSHSRQYNIGDLLPSFFAGFAFRLLIPGGHAEITKIFLLRGRKRGKAIAFGVEKSFQTVFKILVVLIALPVVFPQFKIIFWTLAVLTVTILSLAPLALKKDWFSKHLEKSVSYAKIFTISFIHSVPILLTIAWQYFYLLNLSFDITFFQTTLVTVFILGAGLIPISVSGLGIRENLAVFFLSRFAIPGYSAVAVSLLVFFINSVIPAVIGVFIIFKRKHDLKDAGSEIKKLTQSVYRKGKQRYQDRKSRPNGQQS
jgi:uncharacterized membrane protein YbhN (UPF0104 family)